MGRWKSKEGRNVEKSVNIYNKKISECKKKKIVRKLKIKKKYI